MGIGGGAQVPKRHTRSNSKALYSESAVERCLQKVRATQLELARREGSWKLLALRSTPRTILSSPIHKSSFMEADEADTATGGGWHSRPFLPSMGIYHADDRASICGSSEQRVATSLSLPPLSHPKLLVR